MGRFQIVHYYMAVRSVFLCYFFRCYGCCCCCVRKRITICCRAVVFESLLCAECVYVFASFFTFLSSCIWHYFSRVIQRLRFYCVCTELSEYLIWFYFSLSPSSFIKLNRIFPWQIPIYVSRLLSACLFSFFFVQTFKRIFVGIEM